MKPYRIFVAALTTALSLGNTCFSQSDAERQVPPGKEAGYAADRQSWDKTETKLIADIRREIIKDKTLSAKAQNITITSTGPDKVILGGVVKNRSEREKVLEIARQYAKGGVDDKLTVEQR